MYQIYYFICLIFLIGNLQFTKSQSCPEDLVNRENVHVRWPNTSISPPPCVHRNNILVTKSCINGNWSIIQSNECVSVQKPFRPKCRPGDKELNETVCVYKSSKLQHWTAKLPVVDVEDITLFIKDLTEQTIWLPVNRTEKYGKFVWRILKHYNLKFKWYYNHNNNNNSDYKPDYVLRDCMICNIINKTVNEKEKRVCQYQPEHCGAKHRTVHIYKPESRYFVRSDNITYSTVTNKAYFVKDNCRTLAQPKTEEDNFAIKTLVRVTNHTTCRIGIERDINGAFKWQNSSKFINYTDWLISTNFSNSVVVISKDGWTLENNINDVQCLVCEVDHTTYKTELILNHNKNHSSLILTTYSPHKILHVISNTIGLEDISLGVNYSPIVNDDTNVTENYNKLDIRKVVIVNFINSNFNYYYFKALVMPNNQELITDKLFLTNNNDREYAFKLEIKNLCNSTRFICDPHLNNFYKKISEFLLFEFNENFKLHYKINITSFRAIKILKIDGKKGDIEMLYHLRTNETVQNIVDEYKNVKRLIEELNNKKLYYLHHKIEFDSVKSCMGCLPEFDKKNNRVYWEFTKTGKKNIATNNKTQVLYVRKCGGDYLQGAKWEDSKEIFSNPDERSKYTKKFYNLYETSLNFTEVSPAEVFNNLSNLTNRKMELKAADIYFVSEIMQKVPDPEQLHEDKQSVANTLALIINNMVAANKTSLEKASEVANSTDIILAIAENRLQKLITEDDLNLNGVKDIVLENFMLRTANPFRSGITGLALLSPRGVDNPSLMNYTLRDITANMTIDEVISWEDLEAAIYVPQELLGAIKNYSEHYNTTVRISISIYYNDSLFIENNNNGSKRTQLASRVYVVTIDGYPTYLYSKLPVITKLKVNSFETLCAYWVFGTEFNNKSSGWKRDDTINNTLLKNNTIQVCNFTHLTNFAMLLGKKVGYDTDILPEENKKLEIITAVGCLFSTVGICGIFLTAIIFKSWRQKVGTKVLLNVSACILLQIVVLYLNMKYTETICMITGTLLHYSVLCGFSWSLIMAVLQYLRFVRVMGGPTSHLLLKASVVGWILPLIPVIAALVVNQVKDNKYVANLKELGSNICYPQDLMLYLTLLLPVTLIVFANLVIFVLILYNISWKPSIRNTCNDKRVRIQQLKLAILLFFLLGLTWIVGLVSVLHHSIEFLYFFSATATMQGFILFLFYVVLDQGTCGLWCKMLKSKAMSTKKLSQSQQTTIPTAESNISYNTTKEESTVSLTEVADWNTRVQAVMQELEGTHRVGNDGRRKHQVMS